LFFLWLIVCFEIVFGCAILSCPFFFFEEELFFLETLWTNIIPGRLSDFSVFGVRPATGTNTTFCTTGTGKNTWREQQRCWLELCATFVPQGVEVRLELNLAIPARQH
jgi:hypothetical protein